MVLTPTLLGDLLFLSVLVLLAAYGLTLAGRGRWLLLDPLNAFWGGLLVAYLLEVVEYGDVLLEWQGEAVFHETMGWILASCFFVILGYESRLGPRLARWVPEFPARLDSRRLGFVGVVLCVAAIGGYLYMIQGSGGFAEWFSVPRGGTDWTRVVGYVANTAKFLPLGLALLLFVAQFRRWSVAAQSGLWAASALLLVWFFYLGSRSQLIGFTLMLFAAWSLPRRRDPSLWVSAPVFVALLVVSAFLGRYRDHFTDLSFHLDRLDVEEVKAAVLPSFLGGDEDLRHQELNRGTNINCAMAVIALVPEEIEYNRGYCLLEFVTRPVPRALWPDKRYPHYEAFTPIYHQADLSRHWHDTEVPILSGPAFGFVGHWYAVGGPVALVVAGFLTGAFFRLIRQIYDRRPGSEGDLLVYFGLLPIGFNESAATPLFWIFTMPFALAALIIILRVCRVRSESAVEVRGWTG